MELHSKTPGSIDRRQAFLASVLLVATVFFFGPLELYFQNIGEFHYTSTELVFSLVPILAAAQILAFGSVVLAGPWLGRERVISLAISFAGVAWLQRSILAWDYGVLVGKEIPWERFTYHGIADTGLWILILSFSIFNYRIVLKFRRELSLVLVLTQLSSVLSLAFSSNEPDILHYTSDESSRYSFSSSRNVIVYVIDTFQSDIFKDVITADPDYAKPFDGFTYFPDAVSVFPTTYAAIPLIMTGMAYDNSIPIDDFIRKEFLRNSLPKRLRKDGYHVYLPIQKQVCVDPTLASNLIARESLRGLHLQDTDLLMRFTAFRTAPHFLKRFFFQGIQMTHTASGGSLQRHKDLIFLDEVSRLSRIDQSQPTFKYYHLFGLHRPFRLNERLEPEKLSENVESARKQARAELKIAGRFLEKLKELGIYDKSLLLILSDHGDMTPEKPAPTAQGNMAYLSPLMLVKPLNARGPLKTSRAGVDHSNLAKTIADELGMESQFPGESIFKTSAEKQRTRFFNSYEWEHEFWVKSYLPTMTEYRIQGNSWAIGSWERTGRVLAAEGLKSELPSSVTSAESSFALGGEVRFGQWGNSASFKRSGWGPPGFALTPTAGNRALLSFRIPGVRKQLVMQAAVCPTEIPGQTSSTAQTLMVRANEKRIAKVQVSRSGFFKVSVPSDVLTDGTLNIAFELPDARQVQSPQGPQWTGISFLSLIIDEWGQDPSKKWIYGGDDP